MVKFHLTLNVNKKRPFLGFIGTVFILFAEFNGSTAFHKAFSFVLFLFSVRKLLRSVWVSVHSIYHTEACFHTILPLPYGAGSFLV